MAERGEREDTMVRENTKFPQIGVLELCQDWTVLAHLESKCYALPSKGFSPKRGQSKTSAGARRQHKKRLKSLKTQSVENRVCVRTAKQQENLRQRARRSPNKQKSNEKEKRQLLNLLNNRATRWGMRIER